MCTSIKDAWGREIRLGCGVYGCDPSVRKPPDPPKK